MHRSMFVVAVASILFFAGCGTDRVAPPSSSEIAAQTSANVKQFIEKAQTVKSDEAKAELALLLESLEATAAESGGKYTELLESAKQLMSKYESSAPSAEIKEQLDDLSQKAGALSGS